MEFNIETAKLAWAILAAMGCAAFFLIKWVVIWILKVNKLSDKVDMIKLEQETLKTDIKSFSVLVAETSQQMDTKVTGIYNSLLSMAKNGND